MRRSTALLLLTALPFSFSVLAADIQDTLKLRIIETTDIHTNVMDYDYYKDSATEKFGLARAATLVKEAQKEVTNSVLIDNGDLLQGSPMGDYVAAKGLKPGEVHPVYKAMNQLTYQVGNIGNHEFNYGLSFLKESLNDADFPYINANVYDAKTGKHYFTPYLLKDYQFTDEAGNQQTVKVGYIGFVPPQVMVWDKNNLEGKVVVKDIKETALALVPEMKKAGADVVIAIPHSGISTTPYHEGAENSVYYLTQVPDIDAVAFGHAHAVFPSEQFAHLDNVDIKTGNINGVTSVMPGRWGSHIGVMDLELAKEGDGWTVVSGQSKARPIYDKETQKSLAKADEGIEHALEHDHNATREFVNKPIGKSSDVMYSFLSLVQDDPTVQIVNLAQQDYVKSFIQGDPDLADLPVLSAAAPFKAGGRKDDPSGYTEVEAGQLTFRNAADLYLYPNTLVVLKANGAEVKDWLECTVGQFNQIDPTSDKPQSLINWDGFRTYNFDVIDGLNYQVDITQPAKYDGDCQLVNAKANRIKELMFQGKPIDPKQEFLIAANNYRAYSGKFAGTGSDHIAFDSPDENRSIVANYIEKVSKEKGEVTPTADNNWSFTPIESDTKLDIRFETSPSDKATQFIKDKSRYPLTRLDDDSVGFAVYRLSLQEEK